MDLGLVMALLALGVSSFPAAAPLPDTLDAIAAVKAELQERYWTTVAGPRSGIMSRREHGDWLGWRCSADRGESCFGGDWRRTACPANLGCHPDEDRLLRVLVPSARQHPESGFITGQAVWALGRFGRHLEAMEIAEACTVAEWWCDGLKGHVLWAVGRVESAERHFRRFVEGAPDSIRCAYTDATWILGRGPGRTAPFTPPQVWEDRWSDQPCTSRMAASDTIWWLSDPAYVVEGNDRWAVHIDRGLEVRWHSLASRSQL